MIKRAWVALPVVCLLAILTRAQEQPSSEIASLPRARGVYYQLPSGWMSIPFTMLIPTAYHGGWNLWPSTTVAEIRGPHSSLRVSQLRPTLYVRGISPTVGIYLVREIRVNTLRQLRMNLRRDNQEWAHFIDTIPSDLEQLDEGVVRVRPRGDLPPATYALATGFDQSSRWIFLGFEFEVTSNVQP